MDHLNFSCTNHVALPGSVDFFYRLPRLPRVTHLGSCSWLHLQFISRRPATIFIQTAPVCVPAFTCQQAHVKNDFRLTLCMGLHHGLKTCAVTTLLLLTRPSRNSGQTYCEATDFSLYSSKCIFQKYGVWYEI